MHFDGGEQQPSPLLRDIAAACLRAGAEITRHVELGFETFTKGDESPVTAADHAAEAIIVAGLREAA